MNSQDQLDAASRQLIEKWRGGVARIWEYDVSLSRLVIRVVEKGRPGNLHIICLGTEFICGPVNWSDCSFEIQKVNYRSPSGASVNYELKDEAAKFEVRCGSVGAQEEVEPYV